MRLSSFRVIAAISCLLFGVAAWRLSPGFSSGFSAQAQSTSSVKTAVSSPASQPAQLVPVSATVSADVKANIPATPPIAAPGTEIYTAKRGETIPLIAHRYLGKTSYLTSSELADAIRHANGDRTANILKANEKVVIPGILAAPIVEKSIPVARDFEVRAVYLTGFMAGSDHGLAVIRHWRQVGGNAVVFDIKDSDGSVTIPFEHPLLGAHPVYLHDVPKFVHFLHEQNMHAIARIAIFRDERLVKEHPELAVQSKKNKTAWRENGKLVWTDPSQPKVQDYNIALAKYVAQLGVDEVQFDYVRFPAEGDQQDASFLFQREHPEPAPTPSVIPTGATATGGTVAQAAAAPAPTGSQAPSQSAGSPNQSAASAQTGSQAPAKSVQTASAKKPARHVAAKPAAPKPTGPQRTDVIADFLKKAYAEIHPTGALFSLDVFGVMAWQRQVDLSHTGQDIVRMAKYCDVLSPMIYPSHFFGMDNIEHPGDAPEHFIGESMDRFELITKGSGVVIRPWLQAFHWRTKTYSPEYIKVQVATAREKGGIGFLFWNAANDYSKPFVAMPEMKAENYKKEEPKDASGPDGAKKEAAPAGPKYFRGDELPSASVRASLTPAN